MLKLTKEPRRYRQGDPRRRREIEAVERIVNHFPIWRDLLWGTFTRCYQTNPRAIRQTVTLLALFLHLVPYAHQIIAKTDKAIADIDAGEFKPPLLVPAPPGTERLALSV